MKVQVKKRKPQLKRYGETTKCKEASGNSNAGGRIYYYLKKSPGLIAGLSATIVAAFSALLTYCSYQYESAILLFWKIDLAYININATKCIYGAVAMFSFFCILCFFDIILYHIKETAKPIMDKYTYLKELKRLYRKDVKGTLKLHFKTSQHYDTEQSIHAKKAKLDISNRLIITRYT